MLLAKTSKLVRLGFLISCILMAVAIAIAGTPGSPGDTTADFGLGQLDFVHNTQNFVTSASLSGSNQIAIDSHSSPNHLYVADSQNNRILGWKNATSFTNCHVPDIIIGQPDQYSTAPNQGGSATLSTLSAPSGLAVDSGSNLWVIRSVQFAPTGIPGSVHPSRHDYRL